MRLFHLADTVEVFHRAGGAEAAVEVARARRGTHFDPEVVDLFCRAAHKVLSDLDAMAELEALIEAEPGLRRQLSERELDAALEAVADFTDLRSPFRAGHSRGVAHLAAEAAGLCGLPDREIVTLRRAALVHHIGTHGVPAPILGKPGQVRGPPRVPPQGSSQRTRQLMMAHVDHSAVGLLGSGLGRRLVARSPGSGAC